MPLNSQLLSILACPVCKGDLTYDEAAEHLTCPRCRLRFKVVGEIPNMIVDEAEKF